MALRLDDLAAVLARLLETMITSVRVVSVGESALVVRAWAEGIGPIVAKHQTAGPDYATAERAALSLMSRARCEAVPRVLAAGRTVWVLEDLGDHSLVQLLVNGDPATARRQLVRSAGRLGEAHATSTRLVERYLRAEGPDRRTVEAEQLESVLPRLVRLLTPLRIKVPKEMAETMEEVATRLAMPGPWSTLTMGDPHPGNVVLAERGPVWVDWEKGAVRHAMYDAVGFRFGPTYPADVVDEMERAWRDAFATACPVVADDAVFLRERRLLAAQRVWLTVAGMLPTALEQDVELMGGLTARQALLNTLEQAVALELGEPAPQLLHALQDRWSDTAPSASPFTALEASA